MTEDYPTPAGPPVPPEELLRQWFAYDNSHGTLEQFWRRIAAQAAAWGYRQAREDARRVEARELSAFGLIAGLVENTTAGGDGDG